MSLRLFTLMIGLILLSSCSNSRHQAQLFTEAGRASAQKGDLDAAMDDFDQAIELNPKCADAYYYRGIVKSQLGDWDAAISDFSHYLQLNSQSAVVYFYRGIARHQKGDLKGALADYNQAITYDSGFARAYLNRAMVKSQMEEWDGALADYTRNIKLDPQSAAGYFYRGIAKEKKDDPDGALADYTQAVNIRTNHFDAFSAHIYDSRGRLKMGHDDLDGALADYNQAIELAPRDAGFHMDRGVLNYLNHRPAAAIADFQEATRLQFYYYDYPHIFIWLVKAEQPDQQAAANQELKDYFLAGGGGPDDWPVQVGRFLTGDLSQTDFLKAADSTNPKKDREQHCEAYFYIAMKHLLAGDTRSAKAFFHQCIGTNEKTFYEYDMARIKLKALGEK